MKKLLLLGGSEQQVIAIDTAKRLGYHTILCDYLSDNPGQFHSDKFYQISTTDKQAILEIALREQVDGVVAYASDPAAPTAAFVAEKLSLPTNPHDSTEILCNKHMFRKFLRENGFNAPISGGYEDIESAKADYKKYRLPVIIKPVDSSGSKGVTLLNSWDGYEEALNFAFDFSRSKKIVIEEFIEKKHPYLIGGDIFVISGEVVLWGLMNCHRDREVNSLVPIGKSFPPELENTDLENVKNTLQTLVDKLRIKNGAMNVELIVDNENRVWPIDIGPRNGGNMIPELLGYVFDVDMVEMTLRVAMGEKIDFSLGEVKPFYATHNLHSNTDGILEDIKFDAEAEKYIIRKNIYKKPGDRIEYFDNAAKALGVVFFKFESLESMKNTLTNINRHIKVEICE